MPEDQESQASRVERLIQQLGREEFSLGHPPEIDAEQRVELEIINRVSALNYKVTTFEDGGKDQASLDDLKIRGMKAILGRFPEQKEKILELFKGLNLKRYGSQIQQIEEEE